jgi:methionyl-tRNA formyltransferase
MNTKCIFIGGKQIGANCLKQLLEHGIKPELVIANLDDDGKDKSWHESLIKIALKAGLTTIKNQKVKSPEAVKKILALESEIIFGIGGMQIIPANVLAAPKLGVLNIHPALLPKYRGRFSTAHAIFNGEKETGVTVQWMDQGIDSGPIILQESFQIKENDTGKIVYDNFTKVGTKLFGEFLELWLSEKEIPSTPQNEDEATYYPKGLPGNGKIDWSWSGEQIRNFIRAMTFEPFPPAEFNLGDKQMVIIDKKNLVALNK